MFKVIEVDNFGRESVSDRLIKDNLTKAEANALCVECNKTAAYDKYYNVVSQEHVLYDAYANM